MGKSGRNRLILGSVLTLISAAVVMRQAACGLSGCGDSDEETADDAARAGGQLARPAAVFTIAGDATEPISPGEMAPLDLEFTNPNDGALSVTDLRVDVRDVSAPNADDAHPCTVRDFTVDQVSGGFVITLEAEATNTLSSLGLPRNGWPRVGMINRPVNQDGCKGATITLAYTASGSLGG